MALDPKTKETIREEALRLSKEFAELDGSVRAFSSLKWKMISKVIVKSESLLLMHLQTPAGRRRQPGAAGGGCSQRGGRQ